MKIHEIEQMETPKTTVRVFHGSPYPSIQGFRFDQLHHRTGTPGTLSFTESRETALIYGPHVYAVNVTGRFGDFENPNDVERVYAFRLPELWNRIKNRLTDEQKNNPKYIHSVNQRLHNEIAHGEYALWENVSVWKTCGWDGAWVWESNSRNLIVGRNAQIVVTGMD
jgi:hypothetical protein